MTGDVAVVSPTLAQACDQALHAIRRTIPRGDYFYLEALLRALGRRAFFW